MYILSLFESIDMTSSEKIFYLVSLYLIALFPKENLAIT